MIKPQRIANSTNGTMKETHIIAIPPCCPVSKNPRPSSQLTISYVPYGHSLEVGSLYAYIVSFKGGLRDDTGSLIVRDMEGMIARIAQDCREVLGVDVQVLADLQIAPKQQIIMEI